MEQKEMEWRKKMAASNARERENFYLNPLNNQAIKKFCEDIRPAQNGYCCKLYEPTEGCWENYGTKERGWKFGSPGWAIKNTLEEIVGNNCTEDDVSICCYPEEPKIFKFSSNPKFFKALREFLEKNNDKVDKPCEKLESIEQCSGKKI